MARKDPDSERRRRAAEDLDKALKRGDLDLALAALEKMRRDFPTGALERVGPALRRAVTAAHRTSQWARLHTLALRGESVPALLESGAAPDEADASRWALLWGCVRSRDFARARTLAGALAPSLSGHPAIARCLADMLDREGTLSEDVLATFPECLRRGTDTRLGHEAPAARPGAPPAPTSPDGAREAVLLAAHRLPPLALADCLQRWLAGAAPDIAAGIRATARLVARRELLRRYRDGVALGPPVRVLLTAVGAHDRSREEVETLVEAVRLAASRGGAPLDLERDPDGVALLARALLAEPVFGAAGARWLVSRLASAEAGPGRQRLFERALEAHPGDLLLWASVCAQVIDPDDAGSGVSMSWLWGGLERLCADTGALARGWAAMPPDQVGPLFERLTAAVPLAIGLRLIEQSWPAAAPALRRDLCHLAGELSDEGFSRADLDELATLDLDASMRKLAGRMLDRTLTGPTRGLWTRLGRELLETDPRLLAFAVQAAGDSLSERKRFLAAWLDGRKIPDEWLTALVDVAEVPLHEDELSDTVFNHFLARFERDADALARALLRMTGRAPLPSVRRLAAALLAAAPRRVQDRSLAVREALALARRLSKGGPVSRRRAKKSGDAEAEPRRSRKRAPRPPEQLELAVGGDPAPESAP